METPTISEKTISYFPPSLDNIPAELKGLPQWVAWKAAPNPKKGKPDKVPMNPKNGRGAGSTLPASWGTFDEAVRFYAEWQDKEHSHQSKEGTKTGPIAGVGFVVTVGDPYVGIDLDHCINGHGVIEAWAVEIIGTVNSYAELSPSGTGIRIFVKGCLPVNGSKHGDVEMYQSGRYLTMTGIPVPGYENGHLFIAENQAGIDFVYGKYLAVAPKKGASHPASSGIVQAPRIEDNMLLAKIRASKQADKFDALMNGNLTGHGSHSEADLSLCCILAFWTVKNAEQMDRLFRLGKLYRAKWDERHGAQTYGAMTIAKAIAHTKDVYWGSPQGPQEERHGDSDGSFLPPPPAVPLDAFPPSIMTFLKEAAATFGVPLEIPVACLVALLSCLVGRSRVIRIKQSWSEAGNLWIALVAKSGMGKTPCMNAFFAPVHKREAASKKQYDKELADYQIAEKVYKGQLSAYAAGQANQNKKAPSLQVVLTSRPQEPQWKQALANDTTPEALGEMLRANPKGVLWLKDELASLMLDMDKYTQNKGGTKSNLLSAYDCQPWKTNRASKPERNLHIPKSCIAMFGGVQPGVLGTLFRGGTGGVDEESGFLPRIIFIRAIAEGPVPFSEQTLSAQSEDILENIVSALWAWDITLDASGNEIEKVVTVSAPAKNVYTAWYNRIEEEAHIAENSARLKKLQGQALRLCLLLHCLDAALAGTDALSPVPEDTMKRALLLADWIREHQNQCWPLLTPGGKMKQANPLEMALMQVVVENMDAIAANGGKIKSSELFAQVRKKPGLSSVSDKRLAAAASFLQLTAGPKLNGDRARDVKPELIEEFRATVRSALAVQASAPAMVSGGDSTSGEPSAPVLPAAQDDEGVFHTHSETQGELIEEVARPHAIKPPAHIMERLTSMLGEATVGLSAGQ